MVKGLLAVVLFAGLASFGEGRAPFGDGGWVPPTPVKSSAPLPLADLQKCVDAIAAVHIFHDFEGQTGALQAANPPGKGEMLRGGEIVEVGLSGEGLLGARVVESAGMAVYGARFVSVDAQGIKLRFDVSGLRPGEEAWVVDPRDLTSFGPYMATAGGDAEVWAATVFGDEAVLVVKSPYPETPNITVVEFSHLFRSLADAAKNLSCNVDISCGDADSIAASSAVGFVIIEGVGYCSGTLINNPLTAEFEPLFITANHCICSQGEAVNTEVVWDYRNAECGGAVPSWESLPLRSYGVGLLATDAPLDSTLIRLNEVPAGPYGRSYLGWDTRLLVVGESVKCVHHPDLTQMRVTKGSVRTVADDQNGRQDQTIVHWDVGVTEKGSSGSCLLLDNAAEMNRIVGTLSQGPDHSCTTNVNNIDWFSSFREFYPKIQPYINQDPSSTALGAEDCGVVEDPGICPLTTAMGSAPAALENLRAVRDHVLMPTPVGRMVVGAYYKAGPSVAPVVARSVGVKEAVIAAASPFVRIGGVVRALAK